jgi:hypothetical protein
MAALGWSIRSRSIFWDGDRKKSHGCKHPRDFSFSLRRMGWPLPALSRFLSVSSRALGSKGSAIGSSEVGLSLKSPGSGKRVLRLHPQREPGKTSLPNPRSSRLPVSSTASTHSSFQGSIELNRNHTQTHRLLLLLNSSGHLNQARGL